ncbi:MAG: phage tail tape measure protein [Cloacibacterium sp.]|nr:phage tail tape measure protein [Cloacibacterium sp.]
MSNNTAIYNINFVTNGGQVFPNITVGLDGIRNSVEKTTKVFGDCYKAILAVDLVSQNLSNLQQSFNELIQPGVMLNSNMLELSAITGVTGQGLKDIELAARSTSKVFGTDATQNVESYKLILSQLSPEIAKNSEAMKMMGENANILSKQMSGNTVASTNVLTTSMNQFGVSLDDPIAAAKIMADMMNVMSAGAQAGSAELPQIQQALEQVGMVAKTTGLSFVETNAQIQLLDKAGKKGSEGGVALRNVLTTLSEGRFTSKDAAAGLQAAGISVEYLADTSIPLTDRLRTLRKIQGDTALMTKVFGKENMAAAIAMVNGADEADELATQITGTNSAVEQANIIMGSYAEKMKRAKAWIDDVKISVFNATQPMLPYIQGFFTLVTTGGQLAQSYISIKSALEAVIPSLFKKAVVTEADTVATATNTTQIGIGSVVSRIYASSIGAIRNAFLQATLATRGFSIAMLNIPAIGWVISGVVVLVTGLKLLWEHSRRFREILFGIGEVGKAVFHNIGVFVGRLWNLIIRPIALVFWNTYKQVFTNIWEVVKWAFSQITNIVLWTWQSVIKPIALWIWDIYTKVFNAIWNTVKWVFNAIKNFALGVWNWIKEIFGGFAKWIDEALIQPIYKAFSNVWNWLVNLLDNIMNKLNGFLAPIRELWNQLFSGDGMKDIAVSYKEGEGKGGRSFDKSQAEKNKKEPQEVVVKKDESHKSIFDVAKGSGMKTSTIGGVAAEKTKNKKTAAESGDGKGSGTVRTLNVNKLVEHITINNQNGTFSKEYLVQAVKEALLTGVADFTMVQ